MNVDNALCELSNASNEIDDFYSYISDCTLIETKPSLTQIDSFIDKIRDYIENAEDYLKEEDDDD